MGESEESGLLTNLLGRKVRVGDIPEIDPIKETIRQQTQSSNYSLHKWAMHRLKVHASEVAERDRVCRFKNVVGEIVVVRYDEGLCLTVCFDGHLLEVPSDWVIVLKDL